MDTPQVRSPRPPKRRLRGVIALLVVVALVGAAVWLLLGSDDEQTPTASPSPARGSGGFLDSPEEHNWGDIAFRFELEREEGSQLNVYFVTEGSDAEIFKDAKKCAKEFEDDYFSVSCYGFDDEEALEAADPDPETGGMANLCWRAFYSDSEAAAEGTGQKAEDIAEEQDCPETG